jgi:hypothetical protein
MMQTVTYSLSHRVWTNANLAKEFVKVKTYSDLLVLRQDANDELGEPARWVLYVSYFHKSPYPDVDKDRAD